MSLVSSLIIFADAAAQTDGVVANNSEIEARSFYAVGQKLLSANQFGDALNAFHRSFTLSQDKLVMGQVALTYERAGDYENALIAIRTYREVLSEKEQRDVDRVIARYEKMIAEGKSTPLEKPASQPASQATSRPEAQSQPTSQRLNDHVDATAGVARTTSIWRRPRLWTWVALGSAAAFAITAGVVGIAAKDRYDTLASVCGLNRSCTNDEVDVVKRRAIAADVLWGAAGVAAVAGVILFFLEGREPVVTPQVGFGYVGVDSRWRF